MKLLGFRNRMVARPAQSARSRYSLRKAPADRRLTPSAALAAILFVTVVLLCEPSGAIGWLKALAAGAIVPGGAFAIVRVATGQWGIE